MRKCYITTFLASSIMLVTTFAIASFIVPNFVYSLNELQSAINEASRRNLPIVFLYTDDKSDCGLNMAASMDVFNEFKDVSIIVFIKSGVGNDWNNIPNIIKHAIKSPQAGKYIPKTVITDSGAKRVRAIIPYINNKNQRESVLHEANMEMQKKN